jgi:GT2 family glycosyltransferase
MTSNWLEIIHKHFSRNDTEVVMGRLVLLPSTFLGDSISCLGFPAGGAIGFDKIWKVDEKGFTNSFSTCNCAIRKDIFWEIRGFDETFPYAGGEDVFLAYTLRKSNYRIKYCSDVLAYHPARDSLRDFINWQFKRGVSSYIFSKKVSNKKDFISLRAWSTKNIIKHYYKDKKFPLILLLLFTSFITQFTGYILKFIKESR